MDNGCLLPYCSAQLLVVSMLGEADISVAGNPLFGHNLTEKETSDFPEKKHKQDVTVY